MPTFGKLTNDGVEKKKTGPKVGSHHQRGRAIKFAKAGKEAISALSGRVTEIEEAAGLVRGGELDPRSYGDGVVPVVTLEKARAQVMRLLDTKGMMVPMKAGGSITVHDVKHQTVLIHPPNYRGSGSKNCISMPLHEFFLKAGLKFEA